ncbi:MAG: hypothetical protein IJ529_00135 [Alphaproteobacteria bacterium]|nr:hypothetical protein [Alphaproteobacteria bacterium]MBQ9235115.1 hypothetical protein [Alphaproteobacteria bacterium]
MTYFTKNFSAEVILPDGSRATSSYEIDRCLKANNLAAYSDYSPAYLKQVRDNRERTRHQEIFAELLKQYKKRIWND